MDQVKFAAQLQNPNILKIFGIGKVDAAYYISYEFIEGKSLKADLQPLPPGGLPVLRRPRAAHREQGLLGARVRARPQDRGGRRATSTAWSRPPTCSSPTRARCALRGFGYWPSRMREAGVLRRGRDARTSRPSRRRAARATRGRTSSRWARSSSRRSPGSRSSRAAAPTTSPARLGQARAAEPDHRRRRAAQAHRRHPAARRWPAIPAARYAEIQEMRKARRHAALLRRLHAHHLQPRLLHALAVPRGHRARVEGR